MDRHEAAVKLFIEAGDQRMKDAAVILVKGENNDDPLESDNFDAVPTEEGMNVFDEMINSKEAIAKSADTKNSFLIAAALDYEKGELSDKADKALALAEKVPGKSSGGELALLNAWISCWRLRAEYPSAIEATRKALKFVEDHNMPKAKRADLMNTLSNFLFNDRRYAEALDMRFAIVEMFPGERGRLGPIKGFIGSASGRGDYPMALDALRRFNEIKWLPAAERAWAAAAEGRIHRRMGDKEKAAAAADAILAIKGLSKFDAAKQAFDARLSTAEGDEAWDWFANYIRTTEAFTHRDAADLWSLYGYRGYTRFRPDRCVIARDEIAKLKQKPSNSPGQWIGAIGAYEAMETFPRPEEEIKFPTDATSFGVESKSEAFAKDFGWDEVDATECIQQALDSGATTVILENTGSPWYISTVKPRSNQTIILEKGVQVLANEATRKANPHGCHLFDLRGVSNTVIMGKGEKPEDVYVGKYRSRSERYSFCKEEGGSGFYLNGCRNVAIRNLKVAECSQDGLCLSGSGNREIFIENVILDSNYRQACSICCADGLYFRNVSFLNTMGGDPMCGIDVEPAVETETDSSVYLFDCHFDGNAGSAFNIGTSTYYPVTIYAKRCTFEAHGNADLAITARCGVYMAANVSAPSRIVFEECEFRQYSSAYAIRFNTSSFFNVEVRNSKIVDVGAQKEPWWPDVPPILFSLDRDFWINPDWKKFDKEGRVVFDNLVVEGFRDRPLVAFRDQNGHYSVRRVEGTAVHNGKAVDMAQYRYEAPDVNLGEIAEFDPAAYGPPADPSPADSPNVAPAGFDMVFKVPWYVTRPSYKAIWWDGSAWRVKPIRRWCKLKGLGGKAVAYTAKTSESVAKLSNVKGHAGKSFFFEVPPGGRECTFKATGNVIVRNPAGEEIKGALAPGAYGGYRYFKLKPAGEGAEIWSVEVKGDSSVKFFAPLSGVFAEKAEWLPRVIAKSAD